MTRDETMQRLCIIMGEAQDHLGWDHAADCFCGHGGFSDGEGYNPHTDYRNDGKSVQFIEAAAREKIEREKLNIDPTPDSQLIAAAPELLEALLETLAEMESLIKSRNIFCDGGINISNRARAAIAKATGKK